MVMMTKMMKMTVMMMLGDGDGDDDDAAAPAAADELMMIAAANDDDQGSTDAYVMRNAAHGARLEWPSQQETGFFCHEDLRALVERCWDPDPDRRPTMKVSHLQRLPMTLPC